MRRACSAASRARARWANQRGNSCRREGSIRFEAASDRPLRPVVEVTPAACAEIRQVLNHGVAAFRRWGIEPPPGSWIQEAAAWLDTVVARSSLGRNDDEIRRTSAAIALAVDLYHIGMCLGTEANRQIAAELAEVARGRLLGTGGSAAGKDFLSQFWVGALLAQSRLHPHVIAYDRKGHAKPDFVLEKGKVQFAAEVKHPRSPASAERLVLKAASQLRGFEGPGIIIVDATECMSVDPWAITASTANAREQMRAELRALHDTLRGKVSPYTRSGRFSHVSMLITFARYWNWTVDESGDYRRDAGLRLHGDGFAYPWSSQVTGIGHEILDALREGVRQLTGNPPAYEYLDH